MGEKIFSTRINEELQREFRSIVVRRGLTVSAIISQRMVNYVNESGKERAAVLEKAKKRRKRESNPQ